MYGLSTRPGKTTAPLRDTEESSQGESVSSLVCVGRVDIPSLSSPTRQRCLCQSPQNQTSRTYWCNISLCQAHRRAFHPSSPDEPEDCPWLTNQVNQVIVATQA